MRAAAVEELPAWQAERRAGIMAAALRALDAAEFEQVQIRDVARDAGVALGTLYRYFASKDHLYAAAIDAWYDAAERRTSRQRAAPVARVRARAHQIIRDFERHPNVYKAVVLLQTSSDPLARDLVESFYARSQAALAAEFRHLPPAVAEDSASVLGAIIHTGLTGMTYGGRDSRHVYRMIDRYVDLLRLEVAVQDG